MISKKIVYKNKERNEKMELNFGNSINYDKYLQKLSTISDNELHKEHIDLMVIAMLFIILLYLIHINSKVYKRLLIVEYEIKKREKRT